MTRRVVMLNGGDPGTSVGGRTLNVVELAAGLGRRGWDVVVEDVRRRVPFGMPATFDILHAHGYQGSYMACLLRARRSWQSIPLITTLHGWLWHGLKYKAMNRLELAALRASDAVIVQSRAMKQRLHAKGFRDIRIVPTGVTPIVDDCTGRVHPGFRVVYVGRIAREKRLDLAIRAIAVAREHADDLHLDLIGPLDDGRLVASLVALSKKLEVNDRIHWWGQQSRPWQMVHPDVVLLPSDTEGLPRVLLEAAQRGLPAVATRVGGIPDIVDDGVTGALVEAGHHRQLAETLVSLVRAPERLASMSKAALARAVAFEVETMLDRYEALYRELLDRQVEAAAR